LVRREGVTGKERVHNNFRRKPTPFGEFFGKVVEKGGVFGEVSKGKTHSGEKKFLPQAEEITPPPQGKTLPFRHLGQTPKGQK